MIARGRRRCRKTICEDTRRGTLSQSLQAANLSNCDTRCPLGRACQAPVQRDEPVEARSIGHVEDDGLGLLHLIEESTGHAHVADATALVFDPDRPVRGERAPLQGEVVLELLLRRLVATAQSAEHRAAVVRAALQVHHLFAPIAERVQHLSLPRARQPAQDAEGAGEGKART